MIRKMEHIADAYDSGENIFVIGGRDYNIRWGVWNHQLYPVLWNECIRFSIASDKSIQGLANGVGVLAFVVGFVGINGVIEAAACFVVEKIFAKKEKEDL